METLVEVVCPYCGEISTVHVEMGALQQRYDDACDVCCRPIHVEIRFDENYQISIEVDRSSGH